MENLPLLPYCFDGLRCRLEGGIAVLMYWKVDHWLVEAVSVNGRTFNNHTYKYSNRGHAISKMKGLVRSLNKHHPFERAYLNYFNHTYKPGHWRRHV